jgi:RHS repeat-associated protein
VLLSSFYINQLTPVGTTDPFDAVQLQFSEPVDDSSVQLSDFTVSGPHGAIAPQSITRISSTVYQLTLGSGSTPTGTYALTVNPTIRDSVDEQEMDQNRNGTPGEPGDAYNAILTTAGLTIAAGNTSDDGDALIIDGNTATIDGSHSFDSVEILGGATLEQGGGSTLTVSGVITVTGNSTLLLQGANTSGEVNGQWAGVGVTINAADVEVDAGSSISANGQGYTSVTGATGNGPGGGGGNSTVTAGGGYGGAGANSPYCTGGGTYGSAYFPIDLGSAGGGTPGGMGGAGGGAIQLVVSNTLTLNGTISANGGTGNSWDPGGGSGGSIWATVGTLTGSGAFTANAGNGLGGYGVGGGGGGRIAVYYLSAAGYTGFAASTTTGGTGSYAGNVGTAAFFDTSIPNDHLYIYQPFVISANSDGHYGAVTVENGATLTVGGGSVLTIDDALTVTGNSTLLLQGANTSGEVNGQWAGVGVTINAADVEVDAGSSISANGQGYTSVTGATGNGPGGGGGNSTVTAGGGYGGAGANSPYCTGGGTYGSAYFPIDLGSAGGGTPGGMGGAGGGAIQLVVSNTLTLNGTISANGGTGNGWDPGGGSGGGILLDAGTLSGSGMIEANAGNGLGGYGVGGGGGGRVAIYTWNAVGMTLPVANVTVSGGSGSATGQPGTVHIATTPYPTFGNTHTLLHNTATISWAGLGLNVNNTTAEVTAYLGQQAFPIATDMPVVGSAQWNTTMVPDGHYDLRAVFYDAAGNVVGQVDKQVCVNNTAAWYSGTITSNETWTSNQVNVVYGDVTLAAGVTVTIQPGAIIKFADGTGITILAGGVLDASQASQDSPIIFTSLEDDTAGGDTNMDGGKTLPVAGDWTGIAVLGTGTFATSAYTDLRYLVTTESGTLSASQAWLGQFVYHVTGNVTVPSGVTLTINPGAIVKFDPGMGITVQSGGQLIADGTVAQPIIFTSIKDDANGGDTNGDGSATSPAPGDWGQIAVYGSATFDHTELLYGSGIGTTGLNSGAIHNYGGTVTFADSIISQALYDGLDASAGSTAISNSLFTDTDRAVVSSLGGTAISIVNCSFDNNVIGIFAHAGGSFTATNCMLTSSSQIGIDTDSGPQAISYSDVWSTVAGSVNYSGMTDPTGTDGDISADPNYVNAAQGDYRLNYLSPAIDAGNGAVSPSTDMMGDPRYNDPRTTVKKGVPDANGNYPDMGAYEFVERAASNLDMIVTSVTGPASATAGDQATITWTDSNIGTGTVVGPWHDSVYLVSNPGPNQQEFFAGQILVGQGVTLGPGQSYTASGQFRVPGDVAGNHYWMVKTNSAGDIFVGTNTSNDTLISSAPVYLEVPALAIGSTATSGQFAAVGEQHWFEFTPQAGQDILVSLNMADTAGAAELYIGEGYMPSPEHYDEKQVKWNSPQVSAVAGSTSAHTYYVLVDATSLSGASSNFTIQATALTFGVTSVSPGTVGNTGPATLAIHGGELTAGMTYQVIGAGAGGTNLTATTVDVVSSSLVYATFDLTNCTPGSYAVSVTRGSTTSTLPGALSVQQASAAASPVQAMITGPALARVGAMITLNVNYTNTNSDDAPAPLLILQSSTGMFRLPGDAAWTTRNFQVLGINQNGPAGVLPPGYHGTIQVQYQDTTPTDDVSSTYSVSIAIPTAQIDWVALEKSMQPSYIPNAAWDAIYQNFTGRVGSTLGQFQAALDEDATYFSELGESTPDVGQLISFELEKANAAFTAQSLASVTDDSLAAPGMALTFSRSFQQSISGRYTQGILGYGWTTNWDISASTLASGYAVIDMSGVSLFYLAQPDGSYVPEAGDHSVLTLSGGAYRLTLIDGTIYQFNTNGSLAYLQDANGNRITAGYNSSNQLVTLTHSNGEFLTLTYNSQGHLAQLSDSNGLTETYGYDASGNFLTTYTDVYGTTTYTYVTGQLPQQNNALAEISFSDNTHTYFAYDPQGRLIDQHKDGGLADVSYAYLSAGGYTVTDGDGSTSTKLFNLNGETGETIDPNGNVTRYYYNSNLNLAGVLTPVGTVATYTYDANGNILSETDPAGNTTRFTYDAHDNMTSYTDADGNTTSYAYDSSNNLLSITYANGANTQSTYNPLGEATQYLNACGQAVSFQYNNDGLVTQSTFADGSSYTFTYDKFGNVLTATDSTGTITFSYADPRNPYWLTQVSYPNGGYLKFTYNVVGQRTQMVDQTGFTVNYAYDILGRLSELTDGGGNLIVKYTYDSVGLLIQKDMGNGTRSTYQYDSNHNVLSMVDYAPDHTTINSYDDYTYDALNNVLTCTSQDGTWTYTYDADSELVHAVFASSNIAVLPNQDIQYVYDGAGNRVSQTVNGVTTDYLFNNLNQCVSATIVGGGTTTYTYDADGNRISQTDAAGTTTYTFNQLNELVAVSGPGVSTGYNYDPLGNCISQTVNGVTTNFQVAPTNLPEVVATFNGNGSLIAHYTYGVGLVSQVSASGSADYYDFNNIGSTVGITNASGIYVNQYAYLPFGETIAISAAIANSFTYVGMLNVRDDGAGLLDMQTRNYDPTTGQFVSRDPIGLAGGANLQRYVLNNPIQRFDPTGLCWAGAQAGARAGAGMGTGGGGDNLGWCPAEGEGDEPQPDGGISDVPQPDGGISDVPQPDGGISDVPQPDGGMGDKPVVPNAQQEMGEMIQGVGEDVTNIGGHIRPVKKGSGGDPANAGGCQPTPPGPPAPTPPGPAGPGGGGGGGGTGRPASHDPNQMIGPSAYGSANFVNASNVLPYTIDFQNSPTATASCGEIQITQQLDPNLDWSTFQLGDIQLGNLTIAVPTGLSSYSATVDETATLGVYVQIVAGINDNTGVVTWTLTALDPTTMQIPADPLLGLLPPDTSPPEGDGSVSYSIDPKASDTTGTIINAKASIVFDVNAPIPTAQIFDTVDAAGPTSNMVALPTYSPTSFTVSWSGQDDPGGSGVASYDVYVSDNGATATLWQNATTATSAVFTGVDGHTYGFSVMAIDNVGNGQSQAGTGATTTVDGVPPTSSVSALPATESSPSFTVSWSGQDNAGGSGIASYSIYVSDNGSAFTPWLTNQPATTTTATFTGTYGHTYGFYSVATDNVGNVEATPTAAQATTTIVSQPPTISAPNTASVNENASLTFSTGGGNAITVADTQAGSNSDQLSLTSTGGTFTLATTSGLTVVSGANGSTAFSVTGTLANLNAALNGLAYTPTANTFGSGSLGISISDPGDSLSASTAVTITVNEVNQPPTVSAPATASVTEYGSLVFSTADSDAIAVGDVDSDGNPEQLTLTASNGAVTLASTTGLTFDGGTNNGQASIEVTGTLASLDAALNGPTFTANSGYFGNASLAIAINDLGNTGLGGAMSDSTTVAIAVNPLAATHFAVSAPTTATAGTPFSFTVTALGAGGQTANAYTGMVHFTSTDGSAVLPTNTTLTNGVGTFSATLKTAGNQTITATDTVTSSIAGVTNSITVSAAAATHFTVSAPSSATAGTAFNFTMTALDQFGNTATGYAGTVHFTSTDGSAVLPANATLTNGVGTFSATLKTAGNQTITATDTVTSSITGVTNSITVSAAAATHFTVSAPSSATAGTAFNFTMTALDQFGNTATGYAGTIHCTSTDPAAVLPANYWLTNGVGTFSATLKTAGNQTITATDTVTSSITGVTNSITVSAAAATHFTVSAPSSATAGTPFNFTISALDQFGNTANGYTGTVHFTSSDGSAVLPANTTLTNGTGTFSATLKTAGNQTITATDTANSTITGVSGAISVSAAPALEKLVFFVQPCNTTAGALGPIVVLIENSKGQPVLIDNSTVTLSVASGPGALDGKVSVKAFLGIAVFTDLSLTTAGTYTLKACDGSDTPAISRSFNISPAAPAKLVYAQEPLGATAGHMMNPVVVDVEDRYGNIVTGNNSSVTLSIASGPAGAKLYGTTSVHAVNGVATFSNVSLDTAGDYTLRASDGLLVTAASSPFTIAPGPATHMNFLCLPVNPKHGKTFSVQVVLLDEYGNVATGDSSSVTLTLGAHPKNAVLSGTLTAAVINGVATFSNLSVNLAGAYSLIASDNNAIASIASPPFNVT